MKFCKLFYFIVFILLFFISACRDDKEKSNDYSGISELISEKNKARHEMSGKKSVKKVSPKPAGENVSKVEEESDLKAEEENSSAVLYEEKVDIIGSESRRTLSKGIAYVNKKGQIVKIEISKE